MKKLNKLTHLFILMIMSTGLMISCGTEEEVGDASLELTLSSSSVPVGSEISFQLMSSIDGDVSASSTFYVNGVEISGSTFIPTAANDHNEVYGVYDGKTSAVKTFSSTDVVPSAYTQKVLVEDYTGTWCGYCPRMITIVHYLTQFNPNIIPIAIHCPGAPTDPWAYEFALDMTNPANYDAQGQPRGKINRIYELDQLKNIQPCPNDPEGYYPQLLPYLNQQASLGLGINSTLNGNNLNISVKVGFATDSVPDARLVVTLIEDGLAHDQANYIAGSGWTCDPEFDYANMPHTIPNFPQEHVLLKAYTDIYGDVIPQNQIADGTVWTRDFNVQLPPNVTNSNNLTIVAFVLGNGDQIKTREVINVQSAKVGTNQDFD
ncbi:MAG: Omp28-related outer membrane protein [Moheibacter sp.]